MQLDYRLFALNPYLSFVFPALEGLNGIAKLAEGKPLSVFF